MPNYNDFLNPLLREGTNQQPEDEYRAKMKAMEALIGQAEEEKAAETLQAGKGAAFGKAVDTALAPHVSWGMVRNKITPQPSTSASDIINAESGARVNASTGKMQDLLNAYKMAQSGENIAQDYGKTRVTSLGKGADILSDRDRINLERQNLLQKKQGQGAKLTKGQEAMDITFGKDIAMYNAAGGYTGIKSKINSLGSTIAKMGKGDVETGPLTGLAQVTDFTSSMFTPKTRAAGQEVARAVVETLRPILGAQFTQKEGERIVQQTFDFSAPIEVNIDRAKRLQQVLLEGLEAKDQSIKYFQQHETLSGFSNPAYNRSADDIINEVTSDLATTGTSNKKITVSDGRETLKILPEDLEDARKEGFEVVQ